MALFRNRYRIESTRLQGWNYSSPGWYFVTICAKGMESWFGDVVNSEMQLSTIENIVAEEWQKTEQIRNNVALNQWVYPVR